jgi:histone H3/H4
MAQQKDEKLFSNANIRKFLEEAGVHVELDKDCCEYLRRYAKENAVHLAALASFGKQGRSKLSVMDLHRAIPKNQKFLDPQPPQQ